MTIEVRYTKSIMRRAILDFLGRLYVKNLLVPTFLAIIMLVVVCLQDWIWLKAIIIVTALMIPSMLIAGYILRIRQSFKRLELLNDGRVIMTANDAGLSIESASGKAELIWKAYTGIWEFPEEYLLLMGEAQFITLPKSQTPPEFIEFIRQKLPKKT
jgi:hypothetical protein